jgi:hypothetical protein
MSGASGSRNQSSFDFDERSASEERDLGISQGVGDAEIGERRADAPD